jgi:hypothetical protein
MHAADVADVAGDHARAVGDDCRLTPPISRQSRIHLKPDGSLAGAPVVVNSSQSLLLSIAAQSAVRAVTKCAPFSFLPSAKYQAWQVMEIAFDASIRATDKTK